MKKSLILALLTATLANAFATADELYESRSFKVSSDKTGGEYVLRILNPTHESTQQTTLHLYIDADQSVDTLLELIKSWGADKKSQLPTLAILEIPDDELQQNKDLTGDAIQTVTASGGAIHFFDFIKSQLVPFIEKASELSFTQKNLHTHDKSGGFGFYALFLQPGYFDQFYFDSADAMFHDAYLFRAEYEYYKSMKVKFPSPTIVSISSEDNLRSKDIMNRFWGTIAYREYQDYNVVTLPQDPEEVMTIKRDEVVLRALDMLYL